MQMDPHEHHHDHTGHDHGHSNSDQKASCCGAKTSKREPSADHRHAAHTGPCCSAAAITSTHHDVVRDPVCGMTVDPNAGKPTAEHAGRTFHFCSAGCKAKFEANPEGYLTAVDPVCGMRVDRADARYFL